MKNIIKLTALLVLAIMLCASPALAVGANGAQNDTTSTTLAAAIVAKINTQWCLASATGVSVRSISGSGSILWADREAAQVTTQGSSSVCFNVIRGQLGTSANYAHASGAKVWVGSAATSSGDPSRPLDGAFATTPPTGTCTASAQYTLPIIVTGTSVGVVPGSIFTCAGGRWGRLMEQYVPPTQCTTSPTTSTVTNTYIPVGASAVFVLNATTNAAAGTTTLSCTILPPTSFLAQRGAVLVDIIVAVGSQTTAPTSIGTATLGTIAFPTPVATTQTASVVTPVTAGTLTQVGPTTTVLTVTTAGAFLTFKYTSGSDVVLTTDIQSMVFQVPYLQSAAAAMTLNWPGLFVHYLVSE